MSLWAFLAIILLLLLSAVAVSRVIHRVTVYEYQTGLKFNRGRLARELSAGSHWYLPALSHVVILDARPRLVTVPGQEILTRDNVSVRLSLTTTFRLTDARSAWLNAESFEAALYAELQDALRRFVSSLPVEELVARRSEIGEVLKEATRETAPRLGLEIQSVYVKDIMFPGSLRDAFAQVTKARQEGLAALERARGESAAVRNLANAARMVEENPYLFQLRLLQTVSESKGALVVNVPPPPEVRVPRAADEPSAEA